MSPEEILAQPALRLSQDQRSSFFDEGYLLLPGLLEADLLQRLRSALDRAVEESRVLTKSNRMFDLERDHSAEAPRLRRAVYLDDHDPVFWELCSDSPLPELAADLLGPNVRFRDLMMNFKWAGGGSEVKWHQDAPFYPHTSLGTCQFLIMLEEVTPENGPLQVLPGSHRGPIYSHRDQAGEWIGALNDQDLAQMPLEEAVVFTGPAGTVSVHHCLTVHGSAQNQSVSGRPAFVITYAAADAIPYTAPPYPSSHYGCLVRGEEPGLAYHDAITMPLPPDWSGGYTSIFDHQEDE